jgi:proline iminopeptidase
MPSLYPPITPFASGYLDVDAPHSLYYEQCGNPRGVPVVVLHGGPGSGCAPWHRRWFDPARYHIVLYDQRGAGRSRPASHLGGNTTAHLLTDLELLRCGLGIERWLLFGGSWGATLALLYAQAYPQRVSELVLRGVFLARARDRAWFFGTDGVARLFPEAYEAFLTGLSREERADPVAAYSRRLAATDSRERCLAAAAWHAWEDAIVGDPLSPSESRPGSGPGPDQSPEPAELHSRAAIAAHYACHHYFVDDEGVLADPAPLRALRGVIIHGRRDLVCPVESAVTLHRLWPGSTLEILDSCGHAASEPEMTAALVRTTDKRIGPLAGKR